MSILHKSVGALKYSRRWIILEIDQGITDFYHSLIPNYIDVQRPRTAAHITVTRPEYETPVYKDKYWNKYNGKSIEFVYSPIIYNSEIYYWLDCYSVDLEEIRLELGLSIEELYDTPPVGFRQCYHTTIANRKHCF